jgi:hypothetical protein
MDEKKVFEKVLDRATRLRRQGKISRDVENFLLFVMPLRTLTNLRPWEAEKYKEVLKEMERAGLAKTEWFTYEGAEGKKKRVLEVKLIEPKTLFEKIFRK